MSIVAQLWSLQKAHAYNATMLRDGSENQMGTGNEFLNFKLIKK